MKPNPYASFFLQVISILLSTLLFEACQPASGTTAGEGTTEATREGVIEVDGFPLKYIRKGKGEPLVVVGSADYYSHAFSPDLENHFELIFIDSRHFVPGCGPTEEELGGITLSTFSDDLEAVRDALNIDQVGVIGHSVHAQIALDYAVRHPERVSKLIIIGGVPYNMNHLGDLKEDLWNTLADEERKTILVANQQEFQKIADTIPADRQFALSYHYNAPLYWADPKYDATPLLQGLRTCPQVFGKLFGSVPAKEEVGRKLEKLSVPTLVILGKLDFAVPYTAWEEILEEKTGIDHVLMEEASHNPQTEASTAAAFDQHLTSWISNFN